jgi:hypothetical protein
MAGTPNIVNRDLQQATAYSLTARRGSHEQAAHPSEFVASASVCLRANLVEKICGW